MPAQVTVRIGARGRKPAPAALTPQQEYRRVRGRALGERFDGDAAAFNEAVRAYLEAHGTDEPEPLDWVHAATVMPCTCRRCAGTGQFVTGMLNGTPTGPGGPCFRCMGKGYQNDYDSHRNYGWDIHQRVI